MNFARPIKRFVEKGLARIAASANGLRAGTLHRGRRGPLRRAAWRGFFHENKLVSRCFRRFCSPAPRRWSRRARGSAGSGAAAQRPPAASRYAPWGVDLSRARSGDQAGRRFLALCQQHLVPGQSDPGRPHLLGRRHRPLRGRRGAAARHRRDRQPRHRSGQPPGRGHVCELDGRGRDRGARRRRAAPLSRPDRRRADPRRSDPPVRRAGLSVADRRRHHAQSGRSDPLRRRHRPGRARHAQPRLLSARGRPVRRLSRRLPQLCGHHAAPRRHRRSRGQGRRDHRAGAPHRRGALDARAQPRRHPVDQPDDAGPARRAGAAVQLAAAAARARASATSRPIIVRQTTRDPGRGPAVRGGAAADLEGLAGLPLHPQLRPIPAARLRRGQFRTSTRAPCAASQQQRDRWKRGLGVLDGTLGEAVGEIYVRRHFPDDQPPADDRAGRRSARRARRARCARNAWMDEATRTAALAKLDAFDPRIGNPVRFIDYSSIRVDPNDLLGNMHARRRIPAEPAAVAAAQPGRPLALGDDSADDQRLLQPAHQPDHLPGRDPAAALISTPRRIRRSITARSAR